VWLTFSVLLVPAQIVIVTRQPSAAELRGRGRGNMAVLPVGRGGGARAAAWTFFGLLLARGLAPFHLTLVIAGVFVGTVRSVSQMDWQQGIRITAGEVFLLRAAICCCGGAAALANARATVAVVLGLIEIAQTHLRGRTRGDHRPGLLAGLVRLGCGESPGERTGRAHLRPLADSGGCLSCPNYPRWHFRDCDPRMFLFELAPLAFRAISKATIAGRRSGKRSRA